MYLSYIERRTLYFTPKAHFGTFANLKCEELSYPKDPNWVCDPILVNPLKMQPGYSQSSSENATPSSGTSPLASYKEVLPRDFITVYPVVCSKYHSAIYYQMIWRILKKNT